MKKYQILTLSIIAVVIMVSIIMPAEIYAAPDWLYYDSDTPDSTSSSFKFQGVRFSIPDDIPATQLLAVSFYYSTATSCPVKIHVTSFDHMADLISPINWSAINAWNDVDLSDHNVLVPHNFYVILETRNCGSPVFDDGENGGRSFKGRYLQSLNTLLSRNLLIRAEIDSSDPVPVLKEWVVTGIDKVKVSVGGGKAKTNVNDISETWTLYSDGSLRKENNLYGKWKQKGSQFSVSFDTEDIAALVQDAISEDVTSVLVTKTGFSGTEKKDGTIKVSYKFFASVNVQGDSKARMVTIEGSCTGIPD